MSIRSVTDYVALQLQGKVIGNFKPLDVYVEMPIQDRAGEVPKVFVWPLEGHKQRTAGSRGAGRKQTTHSLNIAAIIAMPMPKASSDRSFRDLVEGMMDLLEASPLSATATDTVTKAETAVAFLGEEMRYYYDTPSLTKGQRLPVFKAVIEAQLVEFYAG